MWKLEAVKMMVYILNVFQLWSLCKLQKSTHNIFLFGIIYRKLIVMLLIPLLISGEALLSDISQPVSFQAVKLGDRISITCHIQHDAPRMRVWYKLTTGKRLQLVASTDTLYNLTIFKEPSQHFLVKAESFKSHLTISKTIQEDTGTYYCEVLTLNKCEFGQGTFLLIKGISVYISKVFIHSFIFFSFSQIDYKANNWVNGFFSKVQT